MRHAGGKPGLALAARHGLDAGAKRLGEIAARLQREGDPARSEKAVGPAEELGPDIVDPEQLDEDRRRAEELDEGDRHLPQRAHVEAHQAQDETADDRRGEGDEADLDRDGQPVEQQVALVPDKALPVAHQAYTFWRQRSANARMRLAARKMMAK